MIVKDFLSLRNINFFAIIIGSGPAGICTALELERKKIKSLIIEGGDLQQSDEDLNYLNGKAIGDNYADISHSRLRQFGGSSGHWGGNCNPMSTENFYDWPISKDDLNQYSKKAREILNLNYKEKFYNEKLNNNLNTYNIIWSNVKFGEKYLEHIKKSKYIFLSLKSNLKNLEGSSKSIDLINCQNIDNEIKLKAKCYILSCGGIENSRILLWSKKLDKNLFKNELPIGNYYMDHPYYSIGNGLVLYEPFINYFKKNNIKNIPILTCNGSLYISANNLFLKKNKILNSGIYIWFQEIGEKNNLFKQVRCVAPNFIKNIYENLKIKKKYKISLSTQQEQSPVFSNRITLSQETDPIGKPYPLIYWQKFKSGKKSARIISEELSKLFIDFNFGRISLNEELYNEEDYEIVVGNHQMGGTRIGNNITDSVVDKNLKVHDKDNLFINGSSIFRTGGHSHPTYTIVKLALRLGEHLSRLHF